MGEAPPVGEGNTNWEEARGTHKAHFCHCGKSFRWRSNLQVHELIHTGEKPQWHSVSQGKCNNGTHLPAREGIQTGEKPYRCSKCGKGFLQGRFLATHERIHIREKPCLHLAPELSGTEAGGRRIMRRALFVGTGDTTSRPKPEAVVGQSSLPRILRGDLREITLVEFSPAARVMLQPEERFDPEGYVPSSPVLPAAQTQGTQSSCGRSGFSLQVLMMGEEEGEEPIDTEQRPPDAISPAAGRRLGGAPHTSEVWKYFRQMGDPRWECLLCRRQISCGKVMGHLTNSGMMHHLRKQHKLVLLQGEVGKVRASGFPSQSAQEGKAKGKSSRKEKGSQKAPS